MGCFYVSLDRGKRKPIHRRFNDLYRAQMYATMQMYERDVTAYALTQVRTCKETGRKLVKLIDVHQKPDTERVIRGADGSVLLRY